MFKFSSLLLVAPALTLCAACHITGSEFIRIKTGVALAPDITVCSTGVRDNKHCEPEDTGGGEWQRNKSFPLYNIPQEYADVGYESIMAEVRRYYLGTPYYNGDLHASCKSSVTADAIPSSFQIVQDLDLAAEINRVAVSEVTVELKAKLKAKNIDVSADLVNKFESKLKEEVDQKVQARFLWFIIRYAGGSEDIKNNPQLKTCADVLQKRTEGSFVTGIAGYVILSNKVDSTLKSESTIANALEASVQASYPAQMADLTGSLTVKWKKSVTKTIRSTVKKQDLNTVAFPLYIQFER